MPQKHKFHVKGIFFSFTEFDLINNQLLQTKIQINQNTQYKESFLYMTNRELTKT